MKKLIFVFALMSGVIFTSCGHSTNSTTDKDTTVVSDSDSLVAEVDSSVVDSCLN